MATIVVLLFAGIKSVDLYFVSKGRDALTRNDLQRAFRNFNLALKFNPWNPLTHSYLGRLALGRVDPEEDIYYPEADYQQAIVHYERALALGLARKYHTSGVYRQALENISLAYWNTKQYDRAVAGYLEEIRLFPERSFWPRFFVATDYFNRSNKPLEALNILLPAINFAKLDVERRILPRMYILLARIYSLNDDFVNTEKYATLAFEESDQLDSVTQQTVFNIIAISQGQRKDFAAAEESIRKSNELSGFPSTNNCALASAYYLGENYKKAIEVAKKAGRPAVDYLYSICLNILGKSYAALGDQVEAEKYFRAYLALTDILETKNIFVQKERQNVFRMLEINE